MKNRSEASHRRLLLGVVVVLVALGAVAIALLITGGGEEPLTDIEEIGPAWEEIAAQVPLEPSRRYSDEELGLYDLIDQVVFYRPYFARGRTIDDVFEPLMDRYEYIEHGDSKHQRERLRFEIDVEAAMLFAFSSLPADLGEDGLLVDSYYRWMTECVAEAGFPDVVVDPDTGNAVPIYEAEDEQLMFYESETGFARDRFYDLRYDCAQRAVSYPYLDPDERDALIGRLKKHYLQAVYYYIRDSGEEVPIEENIAVSDLGRDPEAEAVDPRQLSRGGLLASAPAKQQLSGFKFLRKAGAFEYLESYVIDVPPAALFIPETGLNMMISGVLGDLESADSEDAQLFRFELEVLHAALHEALAVIENGLRSMSPSQRLGTLDEAFFDSLEECGHDAVGPDMELFVLRDGLGWDPQYDGVVFQDGFPGHYILDLSYYEYLELLHDCAQRAATYPALDPAVRDDLLAPQREHYASMIVDYIDKEIPPTEIPEQYQVQIEDLRKNGW
jgi:hypothetical protein